MRSVLRLGLSLILIGLVISGGAVPAQALLEVGSSSGLVEPELQSVSPNWAKAGSTLTLKLTGSNFQSGAKVAFIPEAGITIETLKPFRNLNQLEVVIRIASDAVLGPRSIRVTNPNGLSSVLKACFTIRGGNVNQNPAAAVCDGSGQPCQKWQCSKCSKIWECSKSQCPGCKGSGQPCQKWQCSKCDKIWECSKSQCPGCKGSGQPCQRWQCSKCGQIWECTKNKCPGCKGTGQPCQKWQCSKCGQIWEGSKNKCPGCKGTGQPCQKWQCSKCGKIWEGSSNKCPGN